MGDRLAGWAPLASGELLGQAAGLAQTNPGGYGVG
jgi:hypothetical protein